MSKKTAKKTCFVVSPIGNAGSAERIHADWLLEGIIIPVFKENYPDFDVVRADKMPAPGMIDSQIIEQLLDAELVIADITTLNPNVFYEIGIRHVIQKPILHMVLDGSPIPFDIKIFKHLPFSIKTPQDLEAAKVVLKVSLGAVFEESFEVDNPVTRTRGKLKFAESATPNEKALQEQVDSLSNTVTRIERHMVWRGENAVVAEALMNRGRVVELNTSNLGYVELDEQIRDPDRMYVRFVLEGNTTEREMSIFLDAWFKGKMTDYRSEGGDETYRQFSFGQTHRNVAAFKTIIKDFEKSGLQLRIEL